MCLATPFMFGRGSRHMFLIEELYGLTEWGFLVESLPFNVRSCCVIVFGLRFLEGRSSSMSDFPFVVFDLRSTLFRFPGMSGYGGWVFFFLPFCLFSRGVWRFSLLIFPAPGLGPFSPQPAEYGAEGCRIILDAVPKLRLVRV